MEIAIDSLLSKIEDNNKFRYSVSMVFAGLIGAVIVGFFGLSLKDDRVRFSIFSREAGIQFVTLFALVIAIILFGIVGILEGKELAALLGGLSCYILGRGVSTGQAGGQPGVSGSQATGPATQSSTQPNP